MVFICQGILAENKDPVLWIIPQLDADMYYVQRIKYQHKTMVKAASQLDGIELGVLNGIVTYYCIDCEKFLESNSSVYAKEHLTRRVHKHNIPSVNGWTPNEVFEDTYKLFTASKL